VQTFEEPSGVEDETVISQGKRKELLKEGFKKANNAPPSKPREPSRGPTDRSSHP